MIKCPFCNSEKTAAKDSREPGDGVGWRRRRVCSDCRLAFSTRELVYLEKPGPHSKSIAGASFRVTGSGVLTPISIPAARLIHAQLLAAAESIEHVLAVVDA